MTNWDSLNYNYFNHIEVVPYEVPEKEFKWLKKEIEKAKKQKIKANAGLVGHIKEEYNLKRVSSDFENFLITKTDHPAFDNWKKRMDVISETRNLYLDSMWVNYQKKHEFNPIHDHSGVFSFVIFVQIPYDLKKEDGYFKDLPGTGRHAYHTSRLTFVNTKTDGDIMSSLVNVDKSFEGKMFMFPSQQKHLVYPFYTSNKYRITVSGNLKLKV